MAKRKYDYLTKIGLVKENTTREISLLQKNINTSVNLMLSNADKVYLLDVESFDYEDGTVLIQRLNRTTDGLPDLQMVAQKRDSNYVLNTAYLHSDADQFNIFVGAENLNLLIGDYPILTGSASDALLQAMGNGDIPSIWALIVDFEYGGGKIHADVNVNYTARHYLHDFPYMMNRTEIIIHLNSLRAAGKLPNGNVSVPLTDRFHIESTNGDYRNSYAFIDKYFWNDNISSYYYNYTIGCKMGDSFYYERDSTTVFCQKAKNIPINISINLDVDGKTFSSSERIRLLTKPYVPSYLVLASSDSNVEFRPIAGVSQEVTKGSISLVLQAATASCIDLELLPYYYDNTAGRTITVSQVTTFEPLSSNVTLDDQGIQVDSLLAIYSSI